MNLEHDTPKWPEPFAALFARVRYGTYLQLALIAALFASSLMNFQLATNASAHVYEVRPDGSAAYVAEREANVRPRAAEAKFVGKRFVELLYGWNSSTVLDDVTNAVNLCSAPLAEQLSKELAAAQFVDNLRRRHIRTELTFEALAVTSESAREFKVDLRGRADVYPLTSYAGEPIDVRPFAMRLVLGVVPRDPDRRLNGLEVVRIERGGTGTPSGEPDPTKTQGGSP